MERFAPSALEDAHRRGDLVVYNRWLCVSRLRAAAAILVFVGALEVAGIGDIALLPILGLCLVLAGFSALVLGSRRLERAPWLVFHSQHVVDLIAITVGIGAAVTGTPALLFRLVYVLVIVPPSLMSVRAGLVVAAAASLGHETLLVLEQGWSWHTLASIESLAPIFLYFLVAQQCFFYSKHLEEKNAALAELAAHLQASRQRLAGLVDVARTLNSTLNASELWARVNRAALAELRADWAATFLVVPGRDAFRIAAVREMDLASDELASAELPVSEWPVLARLQAERLVAIDDPRDVPALLTGGLVFSSLLLAGLYRDDDLVGCLALGYGPGRGVPAGETLDQLNGIVEHAAIALHNARLLEEARQASVLKSEFVSTISHELRTPLNVIIGYTDMLREGAVGSLSGAQQQIFERIGAEAHGLFELIEATLQVGRIETGRDTVTLSRVPLAELIRALQAVVATLPRPTAIAFEWEDPPDAGGSIVTDAAKVSLILRNLVSNAFKFTNDGRVRVRLDTRDTRLVLSVADTGIGIAAKNLPAIFEMFRQLDSEPGRHRGGVGLGLYIVQQMVRRLDGTIEVDSEPGHGTEFRVTLPNYEGGRGADDWMGTAAPRP